jgi:glycosidase
MQRMGTGIGSIGDANSAALWWQTTVVYQVYPRSFQDTSGNGVGDLEGVRRRLPYLAETLGVGTLWLSPFYPSPMADFGYDVSDYTGVDPLFGTMADFDALLADTHGLGLRLIIDWVPNHTSDQHPWFVASRSSRGDPKRDWYVWRDPKPDGSEPNNWLSNFGGPAWVFDAPTGQYYLATFTPEQADLDWRTPGVQEAMFDGVRFWLDKGVDGIRIDVAHYIMKDPELRDEPPVPDSWQRTFKHQGEYDSLLHLYSKGHPDVHAVYRDLRRLLDSYQPERVAVGEIHEAELDTWASYFGTDGDELHMPFNFALLHAPLEAAVVGDHVRALEAALPEGAWPSQVLGNHDEERLATRVGAERTRVAAMLLLTLRGTPTLYAGDEIGLPQADIPPAEQLDPHGRNVPGAGRDGCRTPMQWDATPNAGFSPDGAGPWLAVTDDWRSRNVTSQLDDAGSLLNLYRRLLSLRRARPALHRGAIEVLGDGDDGILRYRRWCDGDELTVALNLTSTPLAQTVAAEGRVLLSTEAGRTPGDTGGTIELAPFEGVIVDPGGAHPS